MKKLLIILGLFLVGAVAFAVSDTDAVVAFFNKFVKAANSYDKNYFNYYAASPKIVRVVIKPDGQKVPVTVPFERYKKETKKGMKFGRVVRYKNTYTNIEVDKIDDNSYKLKALRKPSTGKGKFAAYFIIAKNDAGQFKIQEESMETPVQKFLEK